MIKISEADKYAEAFLKDETTLPQYAMIGLTIFYIVFTELLGIKYAFILFSISKILDIYFWYHHEDTEIK